MSRRLSLLALALVTFALAACANPTGPAPKSQDCKTDYQGSSTCL
jgi:hypothetical protein